jgi:hypothetical protein
MSKGLVKLLNQTNQWIDSNLQAIVDEEEGTTNTTGKTNVDDAGDGDDNGDDNGDNVLQDSDEEHVGEDGNAEEEDEGADDNDDDDDDE